MARETNGRITRITLIMVPSYHATTPRHADSHGPGLNGRAAALISRTVLSMWTLWASIVLMAAWMTGLGLTVAGDGYPYNLMLLAVGGIAQWLVMIALGVNQNTQGRTSDAQTAHIAHGIDTILQQINQAGR